MEGAHAVLDFVKSQSIRTAVISEGPHDAQEWTLKQLDLTKYVDILVTSNRERISEQDGLFQRFAAMGNVVPEEILIIGDSLENDILPAKALGMHALRFSPSSPQPMTAGVDSIADFPRFRHISKRVSYYSCHRDRRRFTRTRFSKIISCNRTVGLNMFAARATLLGPAWT